EHGADLGTGAAMAVADGDGAAGLRLPVGGEVIGILAIEFAGGVVGDVDQLVLCADGDNAGKDERRGEAAICKQAGREAGSFLHGSAPVEEQLALLYRLSGVSQARQPRRNCPNGQNPSVVRLECSKSPWAWRPFARRRARSCNVSNLADGALGYGP